MTNYSTLLTTIQYAIDPNIPHHPENHRQLFTNCAKILKDIINEEVLDNLLQFFKTKLIYNDNYAQIILTLNLIHTLISENSQFFWNKFLNNENFILYMTLLIHKFKFSDNKNQKNIATLSLSLIHIWGECFKFFYHDFSHLMYLFESLKREDLITQTRGELGLENLMLYKKVCHYYNQKSSSASSASSPSSTSLNSADFHSNNSAPNNLKKTRSNSCFSRITTEQSEDSSSFPNSNLNSFDNSPRPRCNSISNISSPTTSPICNASRSNSISANSPNPIPAKTPLTRCFDPNSFPLSGSSNDSDEMVDYMKSALQRVQELIETSKSKPDLQNNQEYSLILVRLESIRSSMNDTISKLIGVSNSEKIIENLYLYNDKLNLILDSNNELLEDKLSFLRFKMKLSAELKGSSPLKTYKSQLSIMIESDDKEENNSKLQYKDSNENMEEFLSELKIDSSESKYTLNSPSINTLNNGINSSTLASLSTSPNYSSRPLPIVPSHTQSTSASTTSYISSVSSSIPVNNFGVSSSTTPSAASSYNNGSNPNSYANSYTNQFLSPNNNNNNLGKQTPRMNMNANPYNNYPNSNNYYPNPSQNIPVVSTPIPYPTPNLNSPSNSLHASSIEDNLDNDDDDLKEGEEIFQFHESDPNSLDNLIGNNQPKTPSNQTKESKLGVSQLVNHNNQNQNILSPPTTPRQYYQQNANNSQANHNMNYNQNNMCFSPNTYNPNNYNHFIHNNNSRNNPLNSPNYQPNHSQIYPQNYPQYYPIQNNFGYYVTPSTPNSNQGLHSYQTPNGIGLPRKNN